MTIFVIRHGETAANARRVVQTPETPLNARGLAQAERLARRLAREGVARVLSSDLARASMTAGRLHEVTGAPVELDALLQERNFGELRGIPYAELGVDLFAADLVPAQGESWQDLHDRVDRAWARILAVAAATAGNLAVVTHGLVCASLVARHFALPDGESPPAGYANTSLTEVDPAPPHRVLRLNCTAHLDPAGADDAARPVA